MLNIGGGELLIIFLVALIVLGPGKLPDAARQAGQVMREFRRISNGFQREMREAMNDPVAAATKSATTTVEASSTVAAPADVTTEAVLPEIETPSADTSWAGDDPDTRQARAESIAAASAATPINPDADPFNANVAEPLAGSASDDDAEGLSSDR